MSTNEQIFDLLFDQNDDYSKVVSNKIDTKYNELHNRLIQNVKTYDHVLNSINKDIDSLKKTVISLVDDSNFLHWYIKQNIFKRFYWKITKKNAKEIWKKYLNCN